MSAVSASAPVTVRNTAPSTNSPVVPWVASSSIPYQGRRTRKIESSPAMCHSPSPPIATNHRMQIGPNSLDTCAVPRAWIRNSPTRMPIVSARTVASSNTCAIDGMVRSPSIADSTDSDGVMIASP